jgi:hypothetical protein
MQNANALHVVRKELAFSTIRFGDYCSISLPLELSDRVAPKMHLPTRFFGTFRLGPPISLYRAGNSIHSLFNFNKSVAKSNTFVNRKIQVFEIV